MSGMTEALRLADALIEDAADHLEVSHAWDMRPEVTINHRHYMNAIQAVVELRRLQCLLDDCAIYLKEGETPAQRIARDHGDSIALMTLLAREKRKSETLLEALKTVEWHGAGSCWVVDADKVAAAIKAAEEST